MKRECLLPIWHENPALTLLLSQWRAKYSGMDAFIMKRLKELEAENTRLKKRTTQS